MDVCVLFSALQILCLYIYIYKLVPAKAFCHDIGVYAGSDQIVGIGLSSVFKFLSPPRFA